MSSLSVRLPLLLVLLLLLLMAPADAWWPFSDEEVEEEEKDASQGSGGSLIPFEVKTAEQKFLEEAQQLLNLSPLDQCQHRVISFLKKSCGEMVEEELAKMSVQLLNCQAKAEGRQTFPCTMDMTVGECTQPMDAHMWNAYHIVSNRARSVCYATRQQQFRMQTEAAVNRLSRSAVEQIQAMGELAKSQQEVQQLARDSMSTIRKEQDQMLQSQSHLAKTQQLLKNRISDNLLQLAEEKVTIHRGQKELANMTNGIRQQLTMASAMLAEQEEKRRSNQAQIATDLSKLKENVREVWTRIDNSTGQLLVLLEKMSVQYEATLHNLRMINSTVSQVLQLLDTMNGAVGLQLQWVMQHLGGAQDGLKILMVLATHAFFLLLSSLALLFVRAPWVSRLSLLLGVVCNVAAEMKLGSSLTLAQLSATVIAVLIGNWSFVWYSGQQHSHMHCCQHQHLQALESNTDDSSSSMHISDTELDDLYADTALHGITSSSMGELPPTSLFSVSHTSSTPRKCSALARTGLPCRLPAIHGLQYCHRHVQH